MSKASWQENIAALTKEIDPDISVNQNYVYGYTDPGLTASLAYGNLAVLSMEYFIVVFAEDKLLLLEVSMSGKLTREYGVVLYSDIESFKVRRGMLQYVITIKLAGESIRLKLKCNRKMLNVQMMGMGWQKENLEYAESQGWYGLA